MNQTLKNKDKVRLVERMYNEDPEIADQLFHPDCLHHINGSEDALKGPTAIKRSIDEMKKQFTTLRVTIEDMVAEDDRVAFRWTFVGTMAVTGGAFTLHGNTHFCFRDGKVIQEWAIDDRLREMMAQGFQLNPPAR